MNAAIARVAARRAAPEVGEVRAVHATGTAEPPAQTNTVWRGVRPGVFEAYAARRAEIQRPSPSRAEGVPYATPFAWGKCGLVLPRYPGTRVMVVHRGDNPDDPVDVGAVWPSGGAPDSRPGDWWLILPAEVPAARRASLEGDTPPQPYTGKATGDLIDADGNRVIEVGELTIRVGRTLRPAGERPARGTADAITIEHAQGGATLTIGADGKVTIHARNVEVDAGSSGTLTLKGQNIHLEASSTVSMKANRVDVDVATHMNVH